MRAMIVEVLPIGQTCLHLRFKDGAEGNLDLAEFVSFTGVFAPLAQPEEFAKVRLDNDAGTVCWPSGADLDPYVLYSRITGAPLPGQAE